MIRFVYEPGNERVEDGTEQVFMDRGSVEGEIVFSIKGSSRSATGNHGDVFYLAVAKGPLSMTVMRTANLTGNVSMQEKVI